MYPPQRTHGRKVDLSLWRGEGWVFQQPLKDEGVPVTSFFSSDIPSTWTTSASSQEDLAAMRNHSGQEAHGLRFFVSPSAMSIDVWETSPEIPLPKARSTQFTLKERGQKYLQNNPAECCRNAHNGFTFSDVQGIRKYLILKQMKVDIQYLFSSLKAIENLTFQAFPLKHTLICILKVPCPRWVLEHITGCGETLGGGWEGMLSGPGSGGGMWSQSHQITPGLADTHLDGQRRVCLWSALCICRSSSSESPA